ncbi:MAG: hypothetical protein NDI94_06655 [Candidatus Woesearchaeota archaeon]|nr:hypothetical protein [Candidatus Woesearchaeota archaeon]
MYPFYELSSIGISHLPSILDTSVWETEFLSQTNGFDIDEETVSRLKEIAPYSCGRFQKELLISRLDCNLGPSAAYYDDMAQLEDDLAKIFQISFANYVLSRHASYANAGEFPEGCCGPSSRSVMASSMIHGIYSAASVVANGWYTHVYDIYPFILGKSELKGIILADPTSEQVNEDKVHMKIMVHPDYGYKKGRFLDISPRRVMHIGSLNVPGAILPSGQISWEDRFYDTGFNEYIKEAFGSPIVIK